MATNCGGTKKKPVKLLLTAPEADWSSVGKHVEKVKFPMNKQRSQAGRYQKKAVPLGSDPAAATCAPIGSRGCVFESRLGWTGGKLVADQQLRSFEDSTSLNFQWRSSLG